MWKKILTISLVLVMILSLAACAKEEAELPSAEEIVDGAIEAQDDIRAYEFDMDMTMDTAFEFEGETVEMTVVMDSSGVLDIENRQMRIDGTFSLASPGEDELETAIDMYLIGDMEYWIRDFPETGPMWMKSEMTEGRWEEVTEQWGGLDAYLGLLEVAQVEVIGSERVKGVDCYVLQLTPDLEQLWQLASRLTFQEAPDVTEESLQEMFRSFSVKQWIAKGTYFLTKAEIDVAMELTPEALGSPEEEGVDTMDMAVGLLAYNYNQPVSIVLPPEAEEAAEVPM